MRPGASVGDRHHVALAAHRGEDVRPTPIVLELAAQVTNVAIHQVAVRLGVRAPDDIDDVLARHDSAGVRNEHVEQAALERREMRSAPVHGDVAGGHVDMELSDLHVAVELGKMSGRAMDRLTRADHQLGGIEWPTQELSGARATRVCPPPPSGGPYEDQDL